MNEIDELRSELDKYKKFNNQRFDTLHALVVDLRRASIGATKPLHVQVGHSKIGSIIMQQIVKTTMKRFFEKIYKGAFYMSTNAFRFREEDGSPKDSFIRMHLRRTGLLVGYRRNAEGKEDEHGNPTNWFASAFPCAGVGAFNGRETSEEHDMPLLDNVTREYDYPARDLVSVKDKYGVPCLAKNFPKQMNVRAEIESDFYGHSAAFDMYWHRDRGLVKGHEGTLNAMYGSPTKEYNILYWIHAPSNNNSGIELANGWSGTEVIGEGHIGGRHVKVAVKVEHSSRNFMHIALIGEDTKSIDIDVADVNRWLLNDAWDMINNSEGGKRVMKELGEHAPIKPDGELMFDGGELGTEIWFSKPDNSTTTIDWRKHQVSIDGVDHDLFEPERCAVCAPADGVVKTEVEGDTVSAPDSDDVERDSDGFEVLRMKVGDIHDIVDGIKIEHLGDHTNVCKEHGTFPNLQVEALEVGDTIITYTTEFESDFLHIYVS